MGASGVGCERFAQQLAQKLWPLQRIVYARSLDRNRVPVPPSMNPSPPPARSGRRGRRLYSDKPEVVPPQGPPMTEVTRVLSAIEQGEPHAAEQLLPLVYEELR